MAESFPTELKNIKKYLSQADKIDKIKPVVAFYVRLYALELAMHDTSKTESVMTWLKAFLGKLESNRNALGSPNKDDAKIEMEEFALNVFNNADDEDRAGMGSMKTAAAFLTSFIVFDSMKQFESLSENIEQKAKYAKWKAADISKAIKAGRTPIIGSPFDDETDQLEMHNTQPASYQQQPSAPCDVKLQHNTQPASYQQQPSAPCDVKLQHNTQPASYQQHPSIHSSQSKSEPPFDIILSAESILKDANNCLRFQDVCGCCTKLTEALNILKPYS